jgi:hypothetical protein
MDVGDGEAREPTVTAGLAVDPHGGQVDLDTGAAEFHMWASGERDAAILFIGTLGTDGISRVYRPWRVFFDVPPKESRNPVPAIRGLPSLSARPEEQPGWSHQDRLRMLAFEAELAYLSRSLTTTLWAAIDNLDSEPVLDEGCTAS